jgi:TMEM175 potassium channel family protein
MLFLLVMLSLHLQKCVITLSIDIPDLHLNLRVTTITKQFEMYLHVKSYIINFALIAIFWVSYHLFFNFIKGPHILNVYIFIGKAFCQAEPF